MKRYKITHKTDYTFSQPVDLLPHTLRLRPREGHDIRIESSKLDIYPAASLRWHRDIEGNIVATASFVEKAQQLNINSTIIVQQYDQAPMDFLVANYAVNFPFQYNQSDYSLLSHYTRLDDNDSSMLLTKFINRVYQAGWEMQTFTLLNKLNRLVYQSIDYQKREEEGVQSAEETLTFSTGSCRDMALLFIVAARTIGLAARFVSGYIHSGTSATLYGSTHAWAEVFIPGAGWKGFDPTNGAIAGEDHIVVAVARSPQSIPPVAGKFIGNAGSKLDVVVTVTELI